MTDDVIGDAARDIETLAFDFYAERTIDRCQFMERVLYTVACVALDTAADSNLRSIACRIVEDFERDEDER